jgi:hypothetical protein
VVVQISIGARAVALVTTAALLDFVALPLHIVSLVATNLWSLKLTLAPRHIELPDCFW